MMTDNVTNDTIMANRPAMDRFLEKLKDSGNVRLSAQAAGVPRRTVYRWRDKWQTFADEWDEALEEALDLLEGTAWKRAMSHSDRLLMFLLKAHRPRMYNPPQQRKSENLNMDVTQLSDEQLQRIANGDDPIRVIASDTGSGGS